MSHRKLHDIGDNNPLAPESESLKSSEPEESSSLADLSLSSENMLLGGMQSPARGSG